MSGSRDYLQIASPLAISVNGRHELTTGDSKRKPTTLQLGIMSALYTARQVYPSLDLSFSYRGDVMKKLIAFEERFSQIPVPELQLCSFSALA